jgi:RNA-directed DNA polymerase
MQFEATTPTVTDRVVQAAVKNLLEPIFEATFWHVSYGFRPGRGCHGALEHIRMAIRPRAKASDGRRQRGPYQWIIEGDIKGCLDLSSYCTRVDEMVRTDWVDRRSP